MRHLKHSAAILIGQVLFIVLSPIDLAQHLWQTYITKPSKANQLEFGTAYAKIVTTVDKTLARVFPEANDIQKMAHALSADQRARIENDADITLDAELDFEFVFYTLKTNGIIVGYAAEDRVAGKWAPISYLLSLTPDGVVKDVVVLEYQEKRGRPVAKKRFLKQFRDKTIHDRIRIMKDIKGISGASISSNGMTNGIRKLVHIWHELYT